MTYILVTLQQFSNSSAILALLLTANSSTQSPKKANTHFSGSFNSSQPLFEFPNYQELFRELFDVFLSQKFPIIKYHSIYLLIFQNRYLLCNFSPQIKYEVYHYIPCHTFLFAVLKPIYDFDIIVIFYESLRLLLSHFMLHLVLALNHTKSNNISSNFYR